MIDQNKKRNINYGILSGLLESIYVILVGLFMFTTDRMFSSDETPVINFVGFLLLFVFSAGISGIIVFGYPIYLFTKQQYSSAIQTVIATFVTLLVLLAVVLAILLFS